MGFLDLPRVPVLATPPAIVSRFTYKPSRMGWFDMRASYLGTATVDVLQTRKFPGLGIAEMNPGARYFLDKGVGPFTVAGFASIALADTLIQRQPAKDQAGLYFLAWLIESAAVVNNHGLVKGGWPVIVPVLSVRF